MDADGVARQFNSCEEAIIINRAAGVEEVRFHLLFYRLNKFRDIDRHDLIKTSGMASETVLMKIFRLAVVLLYVSQYKKGLFLYFYQLLWRTFMADITREIWNMGVITGILGVHFAVQACGKIPGPKVYFDARYFCLRRLRLLRIR